MKLGEESSELDEVLNSRIKSIGINQCCHLVYTSGTTGKPKSVMLSHDNLTFTARIIKDTYKLKMNFEKNVRFSRIFTSSKCVFTISAEFKAILI